MDKFKSKLPIIGLVGLVLVVVVIAFRLITADETQPVFSEMLRIQATVNELSDMAVSNGNEETRRQAASVKSTTGSDFRQLQQLYIDLYRSSPPGAPLEDYVLELDNTREGYDELYREFTIELLEMSRDRIDFLAREFEHPEVLEVMERAANNQDEQLQRIGE